jgi:hypothetical protein
LAVGSLVAALLASGSGAAGARPAPKALDGISFSAPALTLVTTTHKKLQVSIDAHQSSVAVPANSMTISLHLLAAGEDHVWLFALKRNQFTANTATGKGELKTGTTQIAPFGEVSLTFTPTGKTSTQTCGPTKIVTHRVSVKGTLQFNTHSVGPHRWGNLGRAHHKVRITGRGSLEVDLGGEACVVPRSHAPCSTSVLWELNGATTSIEGEWVSRHGMLHGHVAGVRFVKLAAPAGAAREDAMIVPAPPPSLTLLKEEPTLVATTNGHGASGSVELASPTPESFESVVCSTSHDEVGASWNDASYVNGDSPLTLHEQIEGPLRAPDATTGAFIETSRQTD